MAESAALVPRGPSPVDLRNFQDIGGLIAATNEDHASAEATSDVEPPSLYRQVKALTLEEHEQLWQRVLAVAGEYLKTERLLPGGGECDEMTARAVHAVAALLAAFAEGALDATKSTAMPPAFVEAATLCQEMLLTIPNGQTQALIARALERICTDLFDGREDFFGGILMFLIGKCLGTKMTSADVTRLYKVRDLLGELDWEHESIESLKMQLMRCAASPNFVRSQHGPDLMCLFLTIYPGFTAEVHSTVKNQVMYSRPAVLKSYAAGLFKAWKASEGGTRVQVEHCVQEWATLAIRSTRKSADKARAMLEEFHRHRHADEQANELLCRVYGPLLWRCLKVANCQVRENAARILQYTFALVPSDLGVADREQELARQLRLLRETLEDPGEPVRRVGCSAVCIILKTYWDMMPPGESAELLAVLINKCAQDKKAPMVRAAVAEGFSWVLENPMSHPTMQAVLPQIAELMNDRSPIVRAAFVSLLNALHRCKGFTIGHVISHETLLLRLASEHAEGQTDRLEQGLKGSQKATNDATGEARASPDLVAKRLARLIAPSLFQEDLAVQVKRCYLMLTKFPLALLALLTHVKDITPAHDRVKLAAALFHFGLREAASVGTGNGALSEQRPKMVATLLFVVGLLLEGVAEPNKRRKKKGTAIGGKFPKELESFVYEHICEENFMSLLEVAPTGNSCATRLRDDLLYAVSSLDPARLPKTAEFVCYSLAQASRGSSAAGQIAVPQVAALLRTAFRWGLLGTALEPAWERLMAAAARLRQRLPAAEDTAGATSVVEAAFRDPDVRGVVLASKATELKQIVNDIASAFCWCWKSGLADLRTPSVGTEPAILGPAAQVWPRILGLVLRVALHLSHRSVSPSTQPADTAGTEGASSQQKETSHEEAGQAAQSTDTTAPSSEVDQMEAVINQLGQEMTSGKTTEVLEALEAVVAEKSGNGPQPAKKRAKRMAMPTDIDMVLQVHARFLQALNATNFLSVLKRSGPGCKAGAVMPVLAREVELCLWRWADAADVLNPPQDGSRLARTWVDVGRFLQQRVHSDIPTVDVIEALVRLLCRVTDEVPANDEELRKVLKALFQRLEFEPQLVKTLAAMIDHEDGTAERGRTDAAEAPDGDTAGQETVRQDPIEVHSRVKAIIMELIPSFRNLRAKLMPKAEEPQPGPPQGQDRRRILSSPTPQKMARSREMPGMDLPGVDMRDFDVETMSASRLSVGGLSLGHRSFSVRSRSPPAAMGDIEDELEGIRRALPGGHGAAPADSEPGSPICLDAD